MRHLQVGVTGGIGSGKSLICRIFTVLGVPVYDADSRAKRLMTTDGILISQIQKEFGNLSYHPDGKLNTDYLGKVAFNNTDQLDKLNSLVHPRVASDYKEWVERQEGKSYLIKEAALLFEAGSAKMLDKIIVVSAPEALRIERTRRRDPHRTEPDIKKIIASQMEDKEKIKLADFVIINDETSLVTPQVLNLHERLITLN
jgi:dephospho-CoA kinase